MSYISAALRRSVSQRARDACEYCLFPQAAALFSLEIEHIIAEKHDGLTELINLALACPYCNRFKGSDLGSLIPGQVNSRHFSIHEFTDGLTTSN
jgi:5-methylcytosine-specific restriction endonuclease McrA